MHVRNQHHSSVSHHAIVFGLFVFLAGLLSSAASALTIQTPSDASYLETLAAQEIRRLFFQRTSDRLEIVTSDTLLAQGDLIVVADQSNPLVGSLVSHSSGDGGFFIKTLNNSNRKILVVSGKGGEETLSAAYRFAEKPVNEGGLGIFFGLAEEAIPSVILEDFSLDITLDEAAEPLFATRGLNPWHDFPSGPDLWGTQDYLALISQLPKVGMNFIGLHTYPRYNEYFHYENQTFDRGPEPTVWIGLPGDYNATGQVSWSYPSYYAHSQRPNLIWGLAEYNTGQYHGGTRELFPTDGWGSEVMGETPPAPNDLPASNAVFNRAGNLFNAAFTHAQRIGVKTALGTELPLGQATTDDGETWVRAMPQELQDRLVQDGKTPSDPAVVKDVYKGIFERIHKTHPLDYFWLWTWEVWPGMTTASRQAMEADIALARAALDELGNPFTLGFAGWKLGAANEEPGNDADDDPTVFDDDFSPSSPFFSLLGTAIGFDQLSTDRVRWASTFLEYDAFLGLPELALTRIHEDAVAAVQQQTDGFIAKHWRTRLMSPNVAAMKELMWSFGATGTDPATWAKPTDQDVGTFIDTFYLRWAKRMFGDHTNTQAIANLFIDLESQFAAGTIPKPLDWTDDATDDIPGRPSLFGGGTSPAKIKRNSTDWDQEKARYAFVDQFASLRSGITGAAELERFDYWLRAFQAWKLKGQYGCVLDDFETSMAAVRTALDNGNDASADGQTALALREQLATLFTQIMSLEAQKVFNVSDLGDIMNLEVVNWKQLMKMKHDEDLRSALSVTELPSSANPGQSYSHEPFVQVTANRTQVEPEESLVLTMLTPGLSASPLVKVRPLGSSEAWTEITSNALGRSVYEATIPAQSGDFEYWVQAEEETYPANAPQAVVSVTIAGQPGSTSDNSKVIFSDRFEARSTRASSWQPWEWQGYNTFPSLYFAAEPDGYFSNEQMTKISRFGLAILEFRMGQFVDETTTGFWAGGDLAGFMEEQVQRFKTAHPNGPPMLVYRSGKWAGSMYTKQWEKLQNPSLFLQDARDCEGFIDYPRDVDESGESTGLSYCRWDFRNNEARAAFTDLMAPEKLGSADGVFFDNAMSVACDEAQLLSQMTSTERAAFLDEQLASYAEIFSDLVKTNRYPILSTTVGFSDIGAQVPWENDCPAGEEAVLKALEGIPFARNQEFWMWNLGETAARQIKNSIRETRNGIPVIVHMGYFSSDGGCAEGCIALDGTPKTFSKDAFLEFGMAAFLVSMGPGSYFGFSDMQNDAEGGGWFDVSWEYHSQYDSIVTGKPLGEVEISDNGMVFTRRFENGTIWVNAADGTYEINLSSGR